MAEREELDSMKNLKLKLRISKTQVTKLMNKIKDKDFTTDEVPLELCNLWLEELESKVAKLNELQQEHYDLISNFQSVSEDAIDEELNTQMENDQLYADDVNYVKVMLMQAISPREKEKDALSSDLLQGQLKLKLPELKIPVFSDNSKDPFALDLRQVLPIVWIMLRELPTL